MVGKAVSHWKASLPNFWCNLQYANFVLQAKNAANEATDVCVCVCETLLPYAVAPEALQNDCTVH